MQFHLIQLGLIVIFPLNVFVFVASFTYHGMLVRINGNVLPLNCFHSNSLFQDASIEGYFH